MNEECNHGRNGNHLDALRCTAPTSCIAHDHKCRACGSIRLAGTPYPFYINIQPLRTKAGRGH